MRTKSKESVHPLIDAFVVSERMFGKHYNFCTSGFNIGEYYYLHFFKKKYSDFLMINELSVGKDYFTMWVKKTYFEEFFYYINNETNQIVPQKKDHHDSYHYLKIIDTPENLVKLLAVLEEKLDNIEEAVINRN